MRRWIQKPPLGVQINWVNLISKGLIYYPLMNENSGNKIYDLSNNRNTGSFVGDTKWVSGKFGSCLSFDGTGDYVNVPDMDMFSFTDGAGNDKSYTASFWLWANNIAGNQGLVSKWGSSGNREWLLWLYNNLLIIRNYDSSDNYIGRSTTLSAALHQQIWIHVCYTYNGLKANSGFKIFINAVRVDNDNAGFGSYVGISNSTTPVFIGGYAGSGNFNGLIDNIMIYNRELSASEIQQLYIEPFCLFNKKFAGKL